MILVISACCVVARERLILELVIADQAVLVDHLIPTRDARSFLKSGHEAWTCAWSPDGQYFAWSSGNRVVKLLPWNRNKHRM
jgi:hypothetical protein